MATKIKGKVANYVAKKSRNFSPNKRIFHSSPRLLKPRGKSTIEIDAFKEEIFPTRRGNVLYEQELSLSDKIRSVRLSKRRKLHEIETQKHASLISEILNDGLHNGRLKKANVPWEFLECAPKFIDDSNSENNELDNYVQIDLIDVGFEIAGVTMPNHRQYCVIWWKYNHLCKLDGGTKLIAKVLELYKGSLRAMISRKMALRLTPRLIFRMIHSNDDASNEQSSYHKAKMEYLVESSLIEEYQKHMSVDFKSEDTESEAQSKNETFNDLLMNKIYGDWRYDKHGNLLKAFNVKQEQRQLSEKWIQMFLERTNKLTHIERKILKQKRKQRLTEKRREKSALLNRILSTDPHYVSSGGSAYGSARYASVNDTILISEKKQQTNDDIIMPAQKPRLNVCKSYEKNHIQIVTDDKDLDLVGFVE